MDEPKKTAEQVANDFGRHVEPHLDLTELDRPAFHLLCQVWGKLQTVEMGERSWLELARLFNTLSRQFGLSPYERRRQGQMFGEKDEGGELDEFGLPK